MGIRITRAVWLIIWAQLWLYACAGPLSPGTVVRQNSSHGGAIGPKLQASIEVRLANARSAYQTQSVPESWQSIEVRLSHQSLLTAPKTVVINQNAGAIVPASGVVFSALRPGTGYWVSVVLYSQNNLAGTYLKKGSANPITLSPGSNTVIISLVDPGTIQGSVTVAFPTTFAIGGVSGTLVSPAGVALDTGGNLLVADGSCRIFKRAPDGLVTVLAGTGTCASSCNPTGGNATGATDCDGTGAGAKLVGPRNLALDLGGNIYFADGDGSGTCLLRQATPAGTIATILGGAGCGFSNATNFGGKFRNPQGFAIDTAKTDYYVADTGNHLIRKVNSAGKPSTLSGNQQGYEDDDESSKVKFDSPKSVAIDLSQGFLYIADAANNCIRKVTFAGDDLGETTTIAGGDGKTANGAGFQDGSQKAARFNNPSGLTRGSDGNLYVADTGNHAIRKVILNPGSGEKTGDVVTVAGNGQAGCNSGSGTSTALFSSPNQVYLAADGSLYAANTGCNTVARID